MEAVFAQRAPYGDVAAAEAAVEALFTELPAIKRLGPDSHVLVKPNLLSRHKPAEAVTTHPDALRAVLLALQRRGVRRITVADSPGGTYSPASMKAIYETCGLKAVCDELGAELYTDCESQAVKTEGRLVREFLVLKPVLEADFIVNLPKFKTHALTGLSGAVKNLFGCVPGLHKAEFHMRFPDRALFGQMLVDLCQTVKADVHIIDGVLGMEGDGPAGGTPREVGLVLASEDPYGLDLALCRLMGMDPERVPTVLAAEEAGLAGRSVDPWQLHGEESLWQPLPGFATPGSYTERVDFSNRLPGFLQRMMPLVTRVASPKPRIKRDQCIGCGKCAEICPRQVITVEKGKARIAYKNCIHCFCCHEMCPVKAIGIRQNPIFHL